MLKPLLLDGSKFNLHDVNDCVVVVMGAYSVEDTVACNSLHCSRTFSFIISKRNVFITTDLW